MGNRGSSKGLLRKLWLTGSLLVSSALMSTDSDFLETPYTAPLVSAVQGFAPGETHASGCPEDIAYDTVDLFEVNHFYDEHGRLVFDQQIFYDWCDSTHRPQVRAWRLLKQKSQIPYRDWATGEYEAIWHDGDVLRRVRAKTFRETWTQYDPELLEREYLPKNKRKELFKARVESQSRRN